jgi:SAM-dependent methyltransferase
MPDSTSFYSRPGLNIETYDLRAEHDLAAQGLDSDVAFYLEHAGRVGGPVLELGGGTGRVAWRLAEAGFDVVLLDLSPGMLALAEAKRSSKPVGVGKRLRTVRADMRDFQLDREFAMAIAPFRAFAALPTWQDQRQCLEATRAHLRERGLLILHVFDPRLDLCVPERTAPVSQDRGRVRHPLSGNEVRVEALSRRNDPLAQLLDERWRFTETDSDGRVVRQEEEILRLRWTYRYEMRHLLELAGFEVEAEFSDFQGSPPAYGREQVWLARKA